MSIVPKREFEVQPSHRVLQHSVMRSDEENDDAPHTTTPLLDESSKPAMTSRRQDVCAAALGDFGLWQFRACLLVALVKIPSAWHMANILFTAPDPAPGDFWCTSPHGGRLWEDGGNFSIPQGGTDEMTMDVCHTYDVDLETLAANISNQMTMVTSLENSTTRPCEKFEFKSGPGSLHTVVTEWRLVCNRKVLVSVSQFFYLLGILVGGFLCTILLDTFSPRRLLLVGAVVQILAGIGVAYCVQFELQVALRFATAVACAHMFTSGYMLCSDICGGRCRLVVVCCYEHFWSIGVILLPCLSSLFKDWRYLQLWISIPTIAILMCASLIPESPRWLLKMNRKDEAKKILEEGARVNGRIMPIIETSAEADKSELINSRWLQLFAPSVDWITHISLHLAWAATVVTYYGALLNVKNLGGSVFYNTGVAGVAEVGGVLVGLALILWSSKKWLWLAFILIAGGAACVFCWVIPVDVGADKTASIMLWLAMAGRVAIACSLTLLQVTSAETLAPNFRQNGIFSSVTFARLWLLTAPFIGSLSMYGHNVSLSTFGLITIVGGLATLVIFARLHESPTSKNESISLQDIWSITRPEPNLEMAETRKHMRYDPDVI